MRLFELSPDTAFETDLEARHRWGLPGVKCDACGATWANIGIAYPTVDLSGLRDNDRYTKSWPVTWEEFCTAQKAVSPLLPPGALAPPGTAIGPLIGTIKGIVAEVVWQNPWTLLVRADVLDQLRVKGVRRLFGRKAALTGSDDLPELVELELEPRGRVVVESDAVARPCTKCGRQTITRPPNLVIDNSSIPGDRDIFRLSDLTTIILATEKAVDALAGAGIRGLRFQSVASA